MQIFEDLLLELEEKNKEYKKLCEMLEYEEVLEDKNMFLHLNKKMLALQPIINKFNLIKETTKNINELNNVIANTEDKEKLMFLKELEFEKKNMEVYKQELLKLYATQNANHQEILIEINKNKEELSCTLSEILISSYSEYLKNNFCSYKVFLQNNSSFISVSGDNVKDFFELEKGTHIIKQNNKESFCYVFVYSNIPNTTYTFSNKELEITACRSSGAGGQHINKTESSIKIVHLPTGLVGISQDERSQFQNKQKALERLKEKVFAFLDNERNKLIENQKKQQLKLIKTIVKTYNLDDQIIVNNAKQQIKLSAFTTGKVLN